MEREVFLIHSYIYDMFTGRSYKKSGVCYSELCPLSQYCRWVYHLPCQIYYDCRYHHPRLHSGVPPGFLGVNIVKKLSFKTTWMKVGILCQMTPIPETVASLKSNIGGETPIKSCLSDRNNMSICPLVANESIIPIYWQKCVCYNLVLGLRNMGWVEFLPHFIQFFWVHLDIP